MKKIKKKFVSFFFLVLPIFFIFLSLFFVLNGKFNYSSQASSNKIKWPCGIDIKNNYRITNPNWCCTNNTISRCYGKYLIYCHSDPPRAQLCSNRCQEYNNLDITLANCANTNNQLKSISENLNKVPTSIPPTLKPIITPTPTIKLRISPTIFTPTIIPTAFPSPPITEDWVVLTTTGVKNTNVIFGKIYIREVDQSGQVTSSQCFDFITLESCKGKFVEFYNSIPFSIGFDDWYISYKLNSQWYSIKITNGAYEIIYLPEDISTGPIYGTLPMTTPTVYPTIGR